MNACKEATISIESKFHKVVNEIFYESKLIMNFSITSLLMSGTSKKIQLKNKHIRINLY